jgi:hypothetical protein
MTSQTPKDNDKDVVILALGAQTGHPTGHRVLKPGTPKIAEEIALK